MKALSFKKEGVVSFFLELRKEVASGCEEKGENRRHKRLASRGKEGLSGSKKRRGVGEYFFRLGGFLFKERRQRKVVFFLVINRKQEKGFRVVTLIAIRDSLLYLFGLFIDFFTPPWSCSFMFVSLSFVKHEMKNILIKKSML